MIYNKDYNWNSKCQAFRADFLIGLPSNVLSHNFGPLQFLILSDDFFSDLVNSMFMPRYWNDTCTNETKIWNLRTVRGLTALIGIL